RDIVGIMFLIFRSPRNFDEQERKKFYIFTDLAALAIQKAQVQQQMIQFERETLAWHLHDQITKIGTILDLASTMRSHGNLTALQQEMLAITQDACQGLTSDLRFLHETWNDKVSDDLDLLEEV